MRYLAMSIIAGLIVLALSPLCVKLWGWSVEQFKKYTQEDDHS